ncbi:MAG TPA: hypothetical protein DHN33_11750 [Eubacteriaceae bacterium]|nr:hypothetical protein [Eubacteriaceae bacterium]
MTQDIAYPALALLLVVLIPVALLNRKFQISINGKMAYAVGRMALQLFLVGLFLQYIFELNSPLVNTLYLVMMVFVASFSTVRSCQLPAKQMVMIVFVTFGIPNMLMMLFFNGLIIDLDNLFEAQYYIPIAGMLLGNTLNGNIIGVNHFYDHLDSHAKAYHYRLCISGSRTEAFMSYYKSAVLSSVNPTLASLETLGLVALPGMMTGQILGGSVPMTAIKYQIAIMIAILAIRYFTIHLTLFMTSKKAFDEYDLLQLQRESS